jgi:hypothetical protein
MSELIKAVAASFDALFRFALRVLGRAGSWTINEQPPPREQGRPKGRQH